jgi:alcohol dehydrogenase/L-iditol 2-dehydrogenase
VAVVETAEPNCGADEVVVQMRSVGLCGSDLTVYDGNRSVPALPWVLGHEGGGAIVEVGRDVNTRAVGDLVVIEPNIPCFSCASCTTGRTSLCPRRRVLGMNSAGVLAERVAVPASMTWALPAGCSPLLLATLEPLTVALAAVRRSKAPPGATALVVGAGGLGLQTCTALRALDLHPSVVDVDEGRLALAEELGFPGAAGDGTFSYVFETAGAPDAVRSAVLRTTSGGTLTLMGLGSRTTDLAFADVVRRGLTLTGSIIYDHPVDFQTAIDLLNRSRLDDSIRALGPGVPPDQAGVAFELARRAPAKTWIDLTEWQTTTRDAVR